MHSPSDVEVVGQILRDARVSAPLTQDELSEVSELPQSRISKLERGEITDPGARELVHLSQVLDIDLEDLIAPFRTGPRRTRQPQRRPRLTQAVAS